MEEVPKEKFEEVKKEESILGLVVYSPVIYLLIFLIGFAVHAYYPVPLPGSSILFPIGMALLFIGPIFIIWSQRSIKKFIAREREGKEERVFRIGPYRYSRNPTYLGLALLTLGFSFVASSLFMLRKSVV